MRTTMLAIAGTMIFAGAAFAQGTNTGTAAGNTQENTSCGVTPCVQGTPPAAPGGSGGTGPGALRTEPSDSPVATGAGGGTPGGAAGGGASTGGGASPGGAKGGGGGNAK